MWNVNYKFSDTDVIKTQSFKTEEEAREEASYLLEMGYFVQMVEA